MIKRNLAILFIAIALSDGLDHRASAQVVFNVTIDDPSNLYLPYHSSITENVLAAGVAWSRFLIGNASIELQIQFAEIPTATGGSVTSSFVYNNGSYNVWEMGAAFEARTGIDPNGADFDGRITIGVRNLGGAWWFDPNPTQRTDPIPSNKVDAQTVFLAEIGHVLAFNGWRDSFDGTRPGNYESTFDENITFDGTNFFFTGPKAVSVFGGPVPLTYGNIQHVGNRSPRPGEDLVQDLMNGVVRYRGLRYDISELDLAIAQDVGVALVIPEPSTFFLATFGLLGLTCLRVVSIRGVC